MALLPSFPTDSLYKFMAVLGIVLLAFGLWYYDERHDKASAEIREVVRLQGLTQVKIDRKREEVRRVYERQRKKYTELSEHLKPLSDSVADIDSKRNALIEELKGLLATDKGDAHKARERAEKLRSEIIVLRAKLEEWSATITRFNTEEQDPLASSQLDLIDELKSETVNIKATTDMIEYQTGQNEVWFGNSMASIVVGWILIISGFTMWFMRIQRHEDAILRNRREMEFPTVPKSSSTNKSREKDEPAVLPKNPNQNATLG